MAGEMEEERMRGQMWSRIFGLVVLGTLLFALPVFSANWIMLQGTESPLSDGKPKLWGFAQIEYQYTDGDEIVAGPWTGQPMAANLIGPDLESSSTFNIKRARLGVRGTVPGFNDFNYLIDIEGGNNAATKYGDGVELMDASLTINPKPWFRLRAGQFKYPGSEEGMVPPTESHYIDNTSMAGQLLNEPFFDGDGAGTSDNTPTGKGCFHDIGLQVFGVLPFGGSWEHTYAAMVGNGNGLARSDNNEDLDTYLYWATEWVLAGKGKKRDGLKIYAWLQDGKRTLTENGDQTFDRQRTGAGFTFHKDIFRLTGEYVLADGMIPSGTDGCAVGGSLNNAGTQVASYNLLPEEKANGWYVDAGVRVLNPLWINLRYDRLNRGTEESANERRFDTVTVGLEYLINPKVRLMANYAWRMGDAPNQPDTSVANQNLDNLNNKISAQLQVTF
jgi:hypothetical protein